jgi:hypothetical protein
MDRPCLLVLPIARDRSDLLGTRRIRERSWGTQVLTPYLAAASTPTGRASTEMEARMATRDTIVKDFILVVILL